MPRATETCSCGATITVQDDWSNRVEERLTAWRATHKHQDPTPTPETSWHLEAVDGR